MSSSPSDPLPSSLEELIAYKRRQIAQRQAITPLDSLRALASMQARPLDVSSTLRENRVALAAPVINVNPNPEGESGRLVNIYDPVALARQLVARGAQMLVVPTDERQQGGLDHLTLVANAVDVPVVRQDIVLDEYQVVETRAAGGDGLFLNARLLEETAMRRLISATQRNRMTAIVEVSSMDELRAVLIHDPRVIAINNLDPLDGTADLDKTRRLLEQVPAHIAALSMGGLATPPDVARVAASGAEGLLVELALLSVAAMAATIRETLAQAHAARPPFREDS